MISCRQVSLEVVDFVATTRRWYDRGNPRDAGECATPAKVPKRPIRGVFEQNV